MSERHYKNVAVGSRSHSNGYSLREKKRVVCAFDDETFDQIRSLAIKNNTSFGAQVRQLVEFGLLDVEEMADAE